MARIVEKHPRLAVCSLPRIVGATLAAGLLLFGPRVADAALTTGACLAQKQAAWGELRKCQATERAKGLKGKLADLAKCQTKFQEKLAKISAKATKAGILCRYRDNGDRTVLDYDTGLQWEQKNDFADPANPNHVANTYTWSQSSSDFADGTVFTDFLARLNGSVDSGLLSFSFVEACTSADGRTVAGGFASHCDWRLPTIAELRSILDQTVPGCGSSSPCIGPIFAPTAVGAYWSATTDASNPFNAWFVFFDNGVGDDVDGKRFPNYVRAVRTGL